MSGPGVTRFSARGPLRGKVRVPGDKSLSHRAVLLAALAEGTSHVEGLSAGDDVLRTRRAIEAFGATFDGPAISGGRSRLREPEQVIDVGNSGTGMRLLAGFASSLPFLTVLVGDESIHRRPMGRVVEPLRAMGASIEARRDGTLAPLCIRGGQLRGIEFTSAVPSAQVKGAVLFAGLGARGTTSVREQVATRPHTEELFALGGTPTQSREEGGFHVVSLDPRPVQPFSYDVPGDPSQAAFLVVAASIVAGSDLTVENVYVGPGRASFLDVLLRMGADIELNHRSDVVADLHVRHAPLHATSVFGQEVVGLIDEIPVLAVAAAFAQGATSFRDAVELRVKESDRIATTAAGLRAAGGQVEELSDGLVVNGGLVAPRDVVDAAGDHRIAMSFAIAGLARPEKIEIAGMAAVETSWPGFAELIERLTC